MTDFLSELAGKRQKYLEGLDANQGDINLDIFEDFYPDRAHFVYEILQNAEDAKASHVTFKLSPDGCLVEHNGARAFSEDDVRSITGIHNSTKKNRPDQIGRWGIGFKSVFVYTISPEIRSGDFSFRIVRLIKPEPIQSIQNDQSLTQFWLPFNNPQKAAEDAFREVASGLKDLSESALLFLENIDSINWEIENNERGEAICLNHTNEHVEVLKRVNGAVTSRSHYLRFTEPVEGLEKQNVAIAFCLDQRPGHAEFDKTRPLNEQVTIVPAVGQVAVFFPAKKETSGLRFHIHAPCVPTLDRASIKDLPENDNILMQLASLAAAAMHRLRDLGFLSRDFLAVLPNAQDQLGNSQDDKRYDPIRSAIIDAFNNEPLMPTFDKDHAPARHLYQAKASLKELLSDKDIEFLIQYDDIPPRWAANTDKEGSRIQRFMSSLALQQWGLDDFIETVADKADARWYAPNQDFMDWLSAKPVEWLQRMYALFAREPETEDELYQLSGARIIRLSDGTFSKSEDCYFPDEQRRYTDIVPCVDPDLLEVGTSKVRKKAARKFLEELGVKDVGERQLVEALLEKEYTTDNHPLNQRNYAAHLRRFMKLAKDEPSAVSLLKNYKLFVGEDGAWHPADEIYLDKPYAETGMTAFYKIVGLPDRVTALAGFYAAMPIDTPIFARFVESLGARRYIPIQKVSCRKNPEWEHLRSAPGEKIMSSSIDRDFAINNFASLVAAISTQVAKLIWDTLIATEGSYGRNVLEARFRKSESRGSHTAKSRLVYQLMNAEWVPQGDSFVRPAAASAGLLPDDFNFSPGWKWIRAVEFGKDAELENAKAKAAAAEAAVKRGRRQAAAAELGFTSDDLAWIEKFRKVPSGERARLLEEWEKSREVIELPDRDLRNPERRADRVGTIAGDAPERRTEARTRSVSVGREEVKAEAAQYLQQQYTSEGDVICQVCKKPMPFRLDDGSSYFEKVEFLSELKKRHHQNYLALCPNHAAMFRHANSTEDLMLEMFMEVDGNELDVVLAHTDQTIYFTKTHIADLKKVIEVDRAHESEDDEPVSLTVANSGADQ